MKRNNIAKQIGIASLCLGVAISAFSGISSFNKSISFSGKAETTSVQGTDFVSASGDTTTTVTQDASGLRVSSDVAYQATFNRVFYGNTTFTFKFPENHGEKTLYGDFRFRVTDATDANNYFDVIYYVSRGYISTTANNWTTVYLKWKDEIRTSSTTTSANGIKWYNFKPTGTNEDAEKKNWLPALQQKGSRGTTAGRLSFTWNAAGVLSLKARAASYQNTDLEFAGFDGTYDKTDTSTSNNKENHGFVGDTAKTAWGLPKMTFPNGYTVTISSNFTKSGVEDHGTDVLFSSIVNNGKTYNFTTTTSFNQDNYMKAYDTVTDSANVDKTLLGWKDTAGALHSTAAALKSTDISTYSPVYLGFDTKNGASARIESASKSGIRFMTMFNVDDYAAAKDYITSFGTLIAHTNTLTSVGKDFTIDNYSGDATFKQVPNTKSVFTYKDKNTGTIYTAYTMAIVDIAPESYTKEYSARGYIEVTYADATTQIFYTDYNVADNSRSIAKVAYLLTQDTTAYEALSEARKAIVDSYAAAYVVPEE